MPILAVVLPGDASYEAVLRAAAKLAGSEPFEVLSVYPVLPNTDQVHVRSPKEKTAKDRQATKEQIEADLSARALNATVTVPVAKLANLGDEIVERAAAAGASVIVIGTRGHTGLRRLLLGSVAERVVRLAHCDVYVARPPQA